MHLITFLVVVVLIYIYFEPVNHSRKKMERHKTKRENRKKKILRDSLFIAIYGLKRTKNFIYLFI